MTVLPAHAGMIPEPRRRIGQRPSAPRTCGDDPTNRDMYRELAVVLPAHAGMIPPFRSSDASLSRAPRTCGDDPVDPLKVVGFI